MSWKDIKVERVGRWPVSHPHVQQAVDEVLRPSGKKSQVDVLNQLLWWDLPYAKNGVLYKGEKWARSRTDWLPHTADARQVETEVISGIYDPREDKWRWGYTGRDVRKGDHLYNEHVVPWNRIKRELASCGSDRQAVTACLGRLFHIAVITSSENNLLEQLDMPYDWDPCTGDPWARYQAAGIEVQPQLQDAYDPWSWRCRLKSNSRRAATLVSQPHVSASAPPGWQASLDALKQEVQAFRREFRQQARGGVPGMDELVWQLTSIDPNALTPMQAHQKLAQLVAQAVDLVVPPVP